MKPLQVNRKNLIYYQVDIRRECRTYNPHVVRSFFVAEAFPLIQPLFISSTVEIGSHPISLYGTFDTLGHLKTLIPLVYPC
jgi:hypothetical protein